MKKHYKKKLIASGALATSLIFSNTGPADAQTILPATKNHSTKSGQRSIAFTRNIPGTNVSNKKNDSNGLVHAPTIMLVAQAGALGLPLAQIKQAVAQGQTVTQLAHAQGLNQNQYRQLLADQLQQLIDTHELTGKAATFYSRVIEQIRLATST